MTLLLLLLTEAPLPDVILLPEWAQWIVLGSIFVGAARLIWTRAFRPISRLIVMTETVLPVVHEIAVQFKPNGGSSLYDIVSDIRLKQEQFDTEITRLGVVYKRLDRQINPDQHANPIEVDRVDVLRTVIAEVVSEQATKAHEQTRSHIDRIVEEGRARDAQGAGSVEEV